MSIYNKLGCLLKNLNIPNYVSTADQLVHSNYAYFNKFVNFDKNGNHIGGSYHDINKMKIVDDVKTVSTQINYYFNDQKYIFDLFISTEAQTGKKIYSVVSESGLECIVAFIDVNNDYAYLDNVGYFADCASAKGDKTAKLGLTTPGGGTILLKFIINYLRHNKKELNINKVILRDISMKKCDGCNNIQLTTMYFLLHGNTWYGKHGFLPYNDTNDVLDEEQYKKYKNNQKIIQTIKLSDVKQLRKYIIKAYNKIKPNNLHLENILSIYDKFDTKNKLLSEFLKAFLKSYDKTCCLFSEFYLKLSSDIGLTEFRQGIFSLNL